MNSAHFQNKFNLKGVRTHWDKVANIYDSANMKFDATHHQRFEEALGHLKLKKKDRILNYWSRTGIATRYLREQENDLDIVNYEVSKNMITHARNKFPKETFHQGTFYPIPEKDNSFEYIISLETLEHTPNPLLFVEELYRVMKKGGTLVLSCPPRTAEYTSILDNILKIGHGEGPHNFLASKKVKAILKQAKFKLIKHQGTLLIYLGPNWLVNWARKQIDPYIQNTPLREFCIRQFYVCIKE